MILRLARPICLSLAAFSALAQAQTAFDPFNEAGIDEHPGARIPLDAVFTDSHGRSTTLRTLGDGKPMLLVPVLHHCPNICGVTLAGVSDAIAGQPLQPGRDFTLIAFGIDPKEDAQAAADNLARLRKQASARKIGPVTALVGSAASVHAVTHALGYRYAWNDRIGQYAHVAATAVLTPEGRLAGWLYGLNPTSTDLTRALQDARDGKTASWGERLLLLCFHYDPQTGRYTASIEKILRAAAMATVFAIGLLLWRLRKASA